MRTAEALAILSRMGLSLRPQADGRLYVEPRDRITPEARALILEHRAGLLKLVSSSISGREAVSPSFSAFTFHDPAAAIGGQYSCQAQGRWNRAAIGTALDRLPPAFDHNGRRLATETRKFLTSPLFDEALRCGWSLEELFGVDRGGPWDNYERWGLVVGLAWAPRRKDMIERIDAECAVICFRDTVTASKRRRIERRHHVDPDTVLWWECTAMLGDSP